MLEATVRAAIRVAAGESAAAVVGTRVAHLTRGGLNLAINRTEHDRCVLWAVGRGRIPGGWHHSHGWQKRQTDGRSNGTPLTAKPTQCLAHNERAAVEKPIAGAQAQPREDAGVIATKGIVLAPDGNPAVGATVYWLGKPPFSNSG